MSFLPDLKLAWRRLLAAPLFSLFAVLSLAAGVGVTTAVYSVVESLFLQGLGIADPGRLVFIATPYDGHVIRGSLSYSDFLDWRAAQKSFTSVSASAALSPTVVLPATTEPVNAEAVDGAYFSTLGVRAALGRVIQPADDGMSVPVAVLSERFWRGRFSADATLVGRSIRIEGHPFEVIGIAASAFNGSAGAVPGTSLWVPLSAATALMPQTGTTQPIRDVRRLVAFGRLAPAITIGSAGAEMRAIAAALDANDPLRAGQARRQSERPWKARTAADVEKDDAIGHRFGVILVVLAALVLLVACTNLANLVLARGTARRHEFAIRRAIGAPRWRLVQQQCAESLLLAVAGAAAALVVFQILSTLMQTQFNLSLPDGAKWIVVVRPQLNGAAVSIAAAFLLLSLIVFGLEPALQLTRARGVRRELAEGAVAMPYTRRQRMLLRWQVAVSAAFFIMATMFVRYTIAEARHDSGIDLEHMGVAALAFGGPAWDDARIRRSVDHVLDALRNDPSIDAAAVSTALPFGTSHGMRVKISIPGRDSARGEDGRNAMAIAATPSLFSTVGAPILMGRAFDDRDGPGAAAVVVVSELTAHAMFGATSAVGQQIVLNGRGYAAVAATIIGVARDTDVGRLFDRRPLVYLPLTQRTGTFLYVSMRSARGAADAVRTLREALRRADPDVPVDAIGSGREILAAPFVLLRALGVSALALGFLTLALAMAGLFGIQSQAVAQRTREFGMRLSLGATAGHIHRLVLREGCRPVLEGLVIGLVIGVAARASVRSYLDIDFAVLDPGVLMIVPIPLILAALAACYVPARAAGSVDPGRALRHL